MQIFYNMQGEPISATEWARELAGSGTGVALTEWRGVRVSTIYTGIDMRLGETEGFPLIFETMVFGGTHSMAVQRSGRRDHALEVHDQWVRRVMMDG